MPRSRKMEKVIKSLKLTNNYTKSPNTLIRYRFKCIKTILDFFMKCQGSTLMLASKLNEITEKSTFSKTATYCSLVTYLMTSSKGLVMILSMTHTCKYMQFLIIHYFGAQNGHFWPNLVIFD